MLQILPKFFVKLLKDVKMLIKCFCLTDVNKKRFKYFLLKICRKDVKQIAKILKTLNEWLLFVDSMSKQCRNSVEILSKAFVKTLMKCYFLNWCQNDVKNMSKRCQHRRKIVHFKYFKKTHFWKTTVVLSMRLLHVVAFQSNYLGLSQPR